MRATRPSWRSRRSRTWRRLPVKVSSSRGELRGAIALGLATAMLCGCHKAEEEAAPAALSVKAVPAAKGDVAQVVEVAGEISAPPGMDVKLAPLVGGRRGALLVGEGDKVREGQVLARLDGTPLRDAVAQAEAQLAQARAQEVNAQAKLNRSERAFAAGGGGAGGGG